MVDEIWDGCCFHLMTPVVGLAYLLHGPVARLEATTLTRGDLAHSGKGRRLHKLRSSWLSPNSDNACCAYKGKVHAKTSRASCIETCLPLSKLELQWPSSLHPWVHGPAPTPTRPVIPLSPDPSLT